MEKTFEVYYQKASDRMDFFNEREIKIEEIEETHCKVADVTATNLDKVYAIMNKAGVEPNPLANDDGQSMLEAKNIKHTSMSINDIIHVDGEWFQCAFLGWNKLS